MSAISYESGLIKPSALLHFQSMLENFETDIYDYLYDVEPQSNNLFWCGNFREAPSGDAGVFYNAAFRIRNITIPTLKLNFENHPNTQMPLLKEPVWDQTVSIDWFEDVYHSVYKYHEDWQRRWYDRRYDVLRCGVYGKFRSCQVVAFHKVNQTDGLIVTPKLEPILVYELGGLVPCELPNQTFGHDKDGNDEMYSISYKAAKIDMAYSFDLAKGTNSGNAMYLDTNAARQVAVSTNVWNPTGFNEDGAESNGGLEKARIVRSLSTSYLT